MSHSAIKRNPKTCDCGNPGQKFDSSGWYCLECETMLRRVTDYITRMIVEQRGGEMKSDRLRRIQFQDYA